jgi:flagellar biogenesis protein FliO
MPNIRDAKSPGTNGAKREVPEPDHAPKEISLRQQVVFFLKLIAILGIILVFFWWFEK